LLRLLFKLFLNKLFQFQGIPNFTDWINIIM
jgi:hypothetical protein